MLGEPGGVGERRRPAAVVPLQPVELGEELRVGAGLLVVRGQLVERGDQRLRHEPPAIAAEAPVLVRLVPAALRQTGARPRKLSRAGAEAAAGAGQAGHQRVGLGHAGCEPAVTSSATMLRGSPLVTRPSPTSTASAPAPA